MKKEINRVAIVRLSALGDIVNAAVVVQFLKEAYPKIRIEWITEELFAPLLHTVKEIDAIHTINLKEFKKTKNISLLKEATVKLRSLGEFDSVVDMQGLLKSALVARVISKETHGFDKESIRESLAAFFYKTSSHIAYKESVVWRNAFLISDALAFKITPEMLLNKKPIFQTQTLYKKSEIKEIAFVIGASWKSKIYPKERVVDVCNKLDVKIHIIWGNEDEKAAAEWIQEHTKNATLAPKLSLSELVTFISSMDLLIGNDTGPTHIAWAQNIPSITLFGPTNARMIYETPRNIGIKSPSQVNILQINKNDFSIQEIDPNLIAQKAKELLYGL